MRIKILAGIIVVLLLSLITGLFYTQIVRHDFYKNLSERNRIRVISLEAPRGKIYDRDEKLLTTSRIAFDVEVVFQEMKDIEKTSKILSEVLGVTKEILLKRINKAKKMPFAPVKIKGDIDKDKAIQIEEMGIRLPGVIVTTRPLRYYVFSDTFSHVIGYLGKISEVELDKYKTYGYRVQDFVGKDGIEKVYNEYLRGTNGGFQMEVDSRGRQLGVLAIKEPIAGRDLHLTINLELQKLCDSLMEGKRGAIVAMNPETGEIYALLSNPKFDPNIFVSSNNSKKISQLLSNSKTFPLVNRAITGTYPSGSIFKIVVASAALDINLFNLNKLFLCVGYYKVGNRKFNCWNEKGHGDLAVKEALRYSCNAFFYQLGLFLGPERIAEYASKFGLGKPTGIDLPGEARGLVPSPLWKRKTLRSAWYKGETANYAIGQGYLLVTPIQVVSLVSAIANEGKLVEPFIVKRIGSIELYHQQPRDMGLKEDAIKIVKEALRDVVNGKRGTGVCAKSSDVVISGKTGTAQNPHGISHAWFAGFAPFDNPRIAIVVFLEHGGKGGLDPAKFSKEIIEKANELGVI